MANLCSFWFGSLYGDHRLFSHQDRINSVSGHSQLSSIEDVEPRSRIKGDIKGLKFNDTISADHHGAVE